MTVDEFVKARVAPEFQPVVAMLRKLMHETVPEAKEQISYGIPMWKRNRIFVFMNPTKKDITFGFSRGLSFDDKYGLLKGVGKVGRHIKVKNTKDISREVLEYYIRQAVKFDDE